jgi:hypothetical protein
MSTHYNNLYGKSKGKVHPTTCHVGPGGGEYRYSSTVHVTSALDGGRWLAPSAGRFTLGKDLVPILEEAESTTGPV